MNGGSEIASQDIDRWKRVATQAGRRLREILRHTVADGAAQVLAKDGPVPGDVVTEVDHAVQDQLHAFLTDLLPGSSFLGEEGFSADQAHAVSQPVWIVDPLDGTLNFASGLPFFGASVALLVDGRPVVGIVYDCGADVVYDAVVGSGARANNRGFSWDGARAARAPIGISSGFVAWRWTGERRGAALDDRQFLGSRFRIFGSQAVQLCWAAAGALRANINVEAKLWDDAAGWLVCREAGAGYASLRCPDLFPLRPDSTAFRVDGLFSIAGDPAVVSSCETAFATG